MFDRAVTDTPGPTVIQALTSGLQNKNRRSRRDNGLRNPRKMHEEVGFAVQLHDIFLYIRDFQCFGSVYR
jgi:hypothetical protein